MDIDGFAAAARDDSAFIDDGHFGATGFDAAVVPEPDIGIFRNTQFLLGPIAPAGVTICTCACVTRGFWAAGVMPGTEHEIGLATWVAGKQFANTGLHIGATGTNNGTGIGTVAHGAHKTNGAVTIYTAFGPHSIAVYIGSTTVYHQQGHHEYRRRYNDLLRLRLYRGYHADRVQQSSRRYLRRPEPLGQNQGRFFWRGGERLLGAA